jgi:hypothetical protein
LKAVTESTASFQEQTITKRSPGLAHPHNVACEFCCKTILLLMIGGRRTMASNFEVHERMIRKKKAKKSFS